MSFNPNEPGVRLGDVLFRWAIDHPTADPDECAEAVGCAESTAIAFYDQHMRWDGERWTRIY